MVYRAKDKHKSHLVNTLLKYQKEAIRDVLSHAQVATGQGRDEFKRSPLRNRILNAMNEVVRKFENDLQDNYAVEFIPTAEDIIKVDPRIGG